VSKVEWPVEIRQLHIGTIRLGRYSSPCPQNVKYRTCSLK